MPGKAPNGGGPTAAAGCVRCWSAEEPGRLGVASRWPRALA